MVSQHSIRINNSEARYFQSGQGQPILLLHCSGGDHRQWQGMEEYLGKQYRYIAPDLFGYGQSNQDQNWTEKNNPDLDLALALLEQCEIPAHVIGHSWGGNTAFLAALQRPEKVASLTLIEPVAFYELNANPGTDLWLQVRSLRAEIKRCLAQGDAESAAEAFVRYWQSIATWHEMPPHRQNKMAQAMPKVMQEFAILDQPPSSESAVANLLMPVHLIKGTDSPAISHHLTELLRQKLPHADYSTINDAGHLLPLTHKNAVFKVISEWIRCNQDSLVPSWESATNKERVMGAR